MTKVKMHTNMGDITLIMYDDMPITAGNFIKLSKEGFYDGLTFHRVIDGFMIQGGDPKGNGTGGPGYEIEDEFGEGHSNVRGTISMANAGPNTGGSQFFINLVNNTFLDVDDPRTPSAHPVFGEVIDGMDVVDKIGHVKTGRNDKPVAPVIIEKMEVFDETSFKEPVVPDYSDVEGPGCKVTLHTNMGDITIKMHDDMPITTGNFVKLAKQGFYDGVIFHRVIKDFMIQGGDPDGTGMGGPGYTIKDEFGKGHSNIRGTMSMANTGRPNSGGSQFFINLVDNTYLDKENRSTPYAHPVFGTVIDGMDVVDKIGHTLTDDNDRPKKDVIIESVTVEPKE